MYYYRRLPQFEYVAPTSVEEVRYFLQANQAETRVIAGGTITLHRMKERIGVKKYLMSLKAIPGLDKISANGDAKLKIGPMATIQSVADSPIVRKAVRAACRCLQHAGTPQIRSMGTIGGNVACNLATAETMPVLTALGAEAKLTSAAGSRTVLIEELYKELKDGEILTEILVPVVLKARSGYEKWAMRKKFDYATISAAVVMTLAGGKTCKEVETWSWRRYAAHETGQEGGGYAQGSVRDGCAHRTRWRRRLQRMHTWELMSISPGTTRKSWSR